MARRIVDLSVDFDFFVRQDPAHPFSDGQDERGGVYAERAVWRSRYAHWQDDQGRDLYGATSLAEYADFFPGHLFDELARHGLERVNGVGHAEAGDSHVGAYGFFTDQWHRTGPPDILLHLDAHHDCYGTASDDLDCANWLWQLARYDIAPRRRPVGIVWLVPKWLGVPSGDDQWMCDRAGVAWDYFGRWARWSGCHLRHLYLARSPVWVPPHHDAAFLELAHKVQALYPGDRFRWSDHPLKARPYRALAGTELDPPVQTHAEGRIDALPIVSTTGRMYDTD